jgi:hypothetical protein
MFNKNNENIKQVKQELNIALSIPYFKLLINIIIKTENKITVQKIPFVAVLTISP